MKCYILALALALPWATANAQGMAPETCQDTFVDSIRQAAAARDADALHKLYDQTDIREYAKASDERLDARFINDPTCANIQHTVQEIKTLWKSLDEVESAERTEQQQRQAENLLNGAQAQILSRNRAQVLAGMETVKTYLLDTERAFVGKGLAACSTAGGSVQNVQQACDPVPHFKRTIDREFNRLNWPVPASPSAAYAWLIDQYKNGPQSIQKPIENFLQLNVTDLRAEDFGGRVAQLQGKERAVQSQQARTVARETRKEHDATVIGNITSMGDRLKESLWNILGGLLLVFLFPVVFAIPIVGPLIRVFMPAEKAARGLFLLWVTTLPFYAAYVVLGGFIAPLAAMVPGWFRLPLLLLLFVPACVLVQRSRWYAALYARLPARLRGIAAAPRGTQAAAPAPSNGLHGSAHWTTTEQAIQKGHYQPVGHVLADSHGFALGRPLDADNKAMQGYDARFRYMGHVLTIAPNGSGKGIGSVIPNLLDYPGSTVVLDVKGENYAATARFRREQLGHDVYLVDPFGVTGQPSHRFNWIDRLDPDSPAVVEEAGALADLMIVSEGHASDASAHFNETAKIFLRGLLVHVATLAPASRNMSEVRRLLSLGEDETKALLADMITNTRGFDLPPRAARAFMNTPDKERGSLRSTLNRHLAFLDDPRLISTLAATDFAFDDLKRKPMTVYLVMPPHSLHAYRGYVRGFFGQAIMSVLATGLQKPGDLRVLFLLDEFAQLGHMSIIAEKLSVIRGYGAAMWFILQNLGQLKETYPRWQDFFANCNAKQWFGTSDVDTAKYISESLGKLTVEYNTANSSSGSSFGSGVSSNSGAGVSQQFTGRDLLTPDEVMRLPNDVEIVQVQGEAPYTLRRLNYLTDPEYAGRFDSAFPERDRATV
ncbi:type IV secretory system conjugative DNA transfer family protein [Pseudomonas aeruginosa]|nr:type IV secretory system conjugative DNA transfer family protein [Pseudomonas aeruginosa]